MVEVVRAIDADRDGFITPEEFANVRDETSPIESLGDKVRPPNREATWKCYTLTLAVSSTLPQPLLALTLAAKLIAADT